MMVLAADEDIYATSVMAMPHLNGEVLHHHLSSSQFLGMAADEVVLVAAVMAAPPTRLMENFGNLTL